MSADGKKLEAKGRPAEALEAYVASRAWDDAIRLAASLERHADAARYCLEAERPYDAAVCFQKAGLPRECLKALTKVPSTSPRYRSACVQAVRVALVVNEPLESMSAFFMPFFAHAPTALVEAEALKALGDIFGEKGKERLAVSIYRTVVQAFPKDEEARERLAALEKKAAASASASGQFPSVGRHATSGLHPVLSSPSAVTSGAVGATPAPHSAARPSAPGYGSSPSGLAAAPGSGAGGVAAAPGYSSSPSGVAAAPGYSSRPSGLAAAPGYSSSPSGVAAAPGYSSRPSGIAAAPGASAQPGGAAPSPGFASTPSGFQSSSSGVRMQRQRLSDLVSAQGLVPVSLVNKLLRDQPELGNSDASFAEALVAAGLAKHDALLQLQGEQFGLGWLTDNDAVRAVSSEAARVLSKEQAERFHVAALRVVDRQLHVAMENPRDVALVDKLRFLVNHAIVPYFATAAGVRRARAKLYTGEDPGAAELPAWHGRLYAEDGDMVVEPFSDRVTGTREHQFKTDEFQLEDVRAAGVPAPEASSPTVARPAPAARPAAPPASSTSGAWAPVQARGAVPSLAEALSELPPPPAYSAGPVVTPTTLQPEAPLPPPPGVAPGPTPTVGSLVANRYVLQALLGEGGSATVFRARDLELEEPVAIKLFHPMGQKETDSLVARFKLELSLSRVLAHPNIIRLFDLGTHAGLRYLTMELLEGEDLATRLEKRKGPLPLSEAISYLAQLCDGLQAAHERGVIHRDIKPPNLFITSDGVVKLMDFGIARRLSTPGVTMVGTIAGTPEYMSPEQINGFSDVTAPSDLYSLGVTAYQVLTGSLPFAYPELTRVLIAQASETPRPLRERNPNVPPKLEALVLALLAKDPAKRPASARLVAEVLRRGGG